MNIFQRLSLVVVSLALAVGLPQTMLIGAEPAQTAANAKLFAKENLMAWCIVPFDAKRRGPEERAAMLERLGFKHFAYDWRAEHIPTFDAEIAALKKHGVALDAWWFPGDLNAEAKQILDALKRNGVRTQLWVTGGGGPTKSADEQKQRVAAEAARLKPICEAAKEIGCAVGLYNHGGWFGEPENQLEIIKALDMPNVGLVYNQHHGHDHIDRFEALLQKMKPHLYCLNLNGTVYEGEKKGKKILPLGAGELDLPLLQVIARSGYTGPLGILNHTDLDAEARLQDNLDGLGWLVKRLDGSDAGPRPKYRTYEPEAGGVPGGAAKAAGYVKPALGGGLLAAGRDEYRNAPITVECRATLTQKDRYNILVACDTKASAAHWELFSLAGAGTFTAYLPGREPDHVRSDVNIADGQPHDLAMILEKDRVRLFVDGKPVADQAVKMREGRTVPGGLALGRLVEGQFFSEGTIDYVRITRGAQDPAAAANDKATLGFWKFDKQDATEAADQSPLKNPAKATLAAAASAMPPPQAPMPPPGVHLKPVDPLLKAVLIDRSENDVFMAVKCDSMGRLFVGGREAVFVYEPDDKGGYKPKQELMHFPQDSIIIGLEMRGNDLYVLTNAALYLLPEARVKREGLTCRRLLWGLPLNLHVSFHCMAWGPEGDLYLNHGDPMLGYGDWSRPDAWSHWTYILADGTRVPCTGTGAVLRIKPDGTDLKVVATGLRGPVGLCFDPDWNLFTNDNDHESQADRYAPARLLHVTPHIDFGWPRGWMASKSPERSDLVDAMQDDHGRGVPCDMTWYREPLIPHLNNKLLLCRWERFAVTANVLKPSGSTFKAVEEVIATGEHNARPSGICVGRDGRIFVTSLFLPGNVTSPYCPSDLVMLTHVEDTEAHPFRSYDEMKMTGEELAKEAAKISWERRQRAQRELLRRGETPTGRVTVHSLWELDAGFEQPNSLTDEQAVGIAGLTAQPDPHALQVASRLLAEKAQFAHLKYLCAQPETQLRIVGLLAVGMRLTTPPRHELLPASLPLHYEADGAFFKRNVPYVGEPAAIDLSSIGRIGSFTTAEWWRAIARTPEQEELFAMLLKALEDDDPRVQSQAAYYLSLLRDERSEPRIEEAKRAALAKELSLRPAVPVERVWLAGPFADQREKKAHPPELGAIDLTAEYPASGGAVRWQELAAADSKLPIPPAGKGPASHYLYFRIQSAARQPAKLSISGGEAKSIALNGTPASTLDLQPGSNDVLIRLSGSEAKQGLAVSLQARGDVVVVLPEKLDSSLLAERLRAAASAGGETLAAEFSTLDWLAEAKKGDVSKGRALFASLGCAKCHAITSDQKGGGAPSLAEAWRRFTVPQMVESLLLPSKQVAGPFRGTSVRTVDGVVLSGLVVSETKEKVEILQPDGSRRAVAASEIEERKFSDLSPMPFGLVKTPTELRDLLAYLQLQSPVPP